MARRKIRTIADLQRAVRTDNRRRRIILRRSYLVGRALALNQQQFDALESLEDPLEKHAAFKAIPTLEYHLEAAYSKLTPTQRRSLAQQDRAKQPRSRLDDSGTTIKSIVFDLLQRPDQVTTLPAKTYFLQLIEALDERGLHPKVIVSASDSAREKVEYDFQCGRRQLTLGQFFNIVSDVRRALNRNRLVFG
jgi:hypothetical protein